jgi:transcriptional regulator
MFIPRPNVVEDEARIRAFVAGAELITTGPDGYPLATLLPIVWRDDHVIAHMARANRQWRSIEAGNPALFSVPGGQAYITPSWYAAKREDGRVVPTWNYEWVHLTGRATVHDSIEWVRDAVTLLTETHEGRRAEPWAITDAPAEYIDSELSGIVGIEFVIERVEGKAKLSQNRSDADRHGAIAGLGESADPRDVAMSERMRSALER